jgi:hypothetical protein
MNALSASGILLMFVDSLNISKLQLNIKSTKTGMSQQLARQIFGKTSVNALANLLPRVVLTILQVD